MKKQTLTVAIDVRSNPKCIKLFAFLLAIFLVGKTNSGHSQIINTIAGNNTLGYSGDGSAATAAQLSSPVGVGVDGSGNVYIADGSNHALRMVNTSGIISTIAGTGSAGYSGDGGLATAAQINNPWDVVVDGSGNIYFTEFWNHTIRMINTSGVISTFAGTGAAGYSGDGSAATAAQLSNPAGLGIDGSGNIYVADAANNRIRKINTSGVISTIAGTGLSSYSGDGGPATAAELSGPTDVAIDGSGNIFIADGGNYRIRIIDGSGNISTFAGTGSGGYSGDGGLATAAAIEGPNSVAVDGSGNVFIADNTNFVIRQVNSAGVITTYAGININGYSGDGGFANLAELSVPVGLAVDGSGNLFITDFANYVVREITVGGDHACIDGGWITMSSSRDLAGNCIFTATAHVSTINLILGYQWSGAGSATIHHSHAATNTYTFSVAPSGSAIVSVIISAVDTNYSDTSVGPCCTFELSDTANCPKGHMKMSPKTNILQNEDIAIYPNPTDNSVNVTAKNNTINTVDVVDINGKKIKEYLFAGSEKVNIPLDNLPTGVYLFRINQSVSKVVMKR